MSDLEVIRTDPYNAETPERALTHATTPEPNTYVRTNFGVPSLKAAHVIEIGGAVNNPFTLSVRELASMPQHTIAATMECAGNDRLGMHPLPTGEPWQQRQRWKSRRLAALSGWQPRWQPNRQPGLEWQPPLP